MAVTKTRSLIDHTANVEMMFAQRLLANNYISWEQFTELEAEYMEQFFPPIDTHTKPLHGRIAELESENKKLREALERIAKDQWILLRRDLDMIQSIAREALKSTTKETP